MRNYVKALSAIIFGIFILCDINAKPWNNNTREHLFGTVDASNVAHVSIQDEGFRWRNSFNFTINGQQILPLNWWFSPISDVVKNNLVKKNIKRYYNGGALNPNFIHSHLAKIAANVKAINSTSQVVQCASATTAAVTIVIENNGTYYAFSKMLCNDSNQIIATRTLKNNGNANSLISYPDFYAIDIKNAMETTLPVINSNIPDVNKYSCSEGQIIAKIKRNNFELAKRIIAELLGTARQQHGNIINYNNIKLVILHVGTTMDPCAICTRCLVGVSKCINENIDNFLRSTNHGIPGFMHNAKFLIEVSSNDHYPTSNLQDNFAAFGCGNCSHTECAGHDGGEAIPINISLNFPSVGELAIPYGRIPQNNWTLNRAFPPYVVFGRIDNNYNVVNVPAMCAVNHVHNARNDLPIIQ